MSYVLSSATPSTPLSVDSGSIGNISDNNVSTSCGVQGILDNYFFFTLDLLVAKRIRKIRLLQWIETGGNADVNFHFAYSDSPLNSGNLGTNYGDAFSASNSETIDTTQTGDATARYWGLIHTGNFQPNVITVAEFQVFYKNNASFMFNN